MSRFDLYSASPNPSPEQLVSVCGAFLAAVQNKQLEVRHPDTTTEENDLLGTAERLAEQILAQYHSLAAVSEATAGFCKQNAKLPSAVFYVFLYACVREHETFGILLDEVNGLYKDGKDTLALNAMRGMFQDSALMMVDRPTLWGEDGKLKYSPEAFEPMHGDNMRREISIHFARGLPGVEKILADYPLMNQPSRDLLDAELVKRVYRSVLADDNPVRWVLQGKLNDVMDGRVRFQKLFSEVDNPSALHDFEERFHHAFQMVDLLRDEKRSEVLGIIPRWVHEGLTDHDDGVNYFYVADYAIANMTKLFRKASDYGINVLGEIGQSMGYAIGTSNSTIIEAIIDEGFELDDDGSVEVGAGLKQAILLAQTDEFFLDLNLSEKHLIYLLKHRDSDLIREVLKQSPTGREEVFSQDIGL